MKIRYIDRTRDYYRAQGFKADYAWSTNDETPFTPLTKPLSECTVTFVTTAVVESNIPKPIRRLSTMISRAHRPVLYRRTLLGQSHDSYA